MGFTYGLVRNPVGGLHSGTAVFQAAAPAIAAAAAGVEGARKNN
jgi:hypothetical protein